ncbi:Gfo/Idh/MocA family oxidoreductase [Pseudactinotalea sp. Z1732]|uniref:Gfo/Idh/MocA family oxidoreductase n=1 Tax=Micrococcales TaxID=85006 RepID=UPI003C7A7C8F
MRVGFVGTENSHVKHFIRFLNLEDLHPGHRAVALAGGHNERNSELATYGGLEIIVDEPADLIGKVDAAIVCNRDGGLHRGAAEPLLRSGLPVLVDKPLATTVADATALLDAAQESGSTLVSASALRYVPEITHFATDHADHGALRHLHVVGPADPDSEYAGLFFYGIHHVEAVLQILHNPVVRSGDLSVKAQRHGDTVWATTQIAGVTVTFTFVTPSGQDRVPFHATAVRTRGVLASELSLGPDYNAPALKTFIEAVKAGKSPLSPEQLLSPVVVLSALTEAQEATR